MKNLRKKARAFATAQFSRTAVVGGLLPEVPGSLVPATWMRTIQTVTGRGRLD